MLRRIVLRDPTAGEWLVFTQPVQVLSARTPADVVDVLSEAERCVQDERLYAAGFLCYEAAPAFDAAFVTRPAGDLPLACIALFRSPERISRLPAGEGPGRLPEWQFTGARADYVAAIDTIRQQIRSGNTYQVNYTVRQCAHGIDDAWPLFVHLARDAPYAAFIEVADFQIVSASPELFFRLSGDRLECRPMKGTAARGMTAAQDDEKRRALLTSIKDRAENVMIADMVRNDLGRIAAPGSVQAASLYDVQKFRTVWQMTSTVTADTRSSLVDIFRALFPSASVTGAPKVASMRLIAELETSPRQVYTGAIGYLAPGRKACFSVAIRTASIDRKSGIGTYGVGGGIVWDSDPEDEFQECLDKARVLNEAIPVEDFRLLETMLWTADADGGFHLLDAHLDRLQSSAGYFGFMLNRVDAQQRLEALGHSLSPGTSQRVRFLLARDGAAEVSAQPVGAPGSERQWRVVLAASPVDAGDPFLYHKTTRREVYAEALEAAAGCDDVLLWNTDGFVTESTIGNLVVRLDGQLVTPPVCCGLLAGTFREKLLQDGTIAERMVTVAELNSATEFFLVNSVRGWISCMLCDTGRPGLLEPGQRCGRQGL